MSIDNFWVAEREYNPEEAYFNEADGLYYCVDCRTPVEAYFAEKEKGKHPCMCKCRREEHERREKERKAREHADIIDKLRQDAFSGKRMYDWKLENSHADVKQVEIAKKICGYMAGDGTEKSRIAFCGRCRQRKIFYSGLYC